ncbi:hypothetical protein AUC70_02280 [Methyloceanibacter stevinii]|uniref:Uncharacterized protein n=1 Tax=Methyloceanibacter stevinii TaxID=1774970 RepID=A0A1E3VR18_9HYPH|nr:hypothetical protein [Methyloceanibacter stevinii]ODR95731.1 hypothetical protein AUC70_02280 [Methyloceanibacter stevinii]
MSIRIPALRALCLSLATFLALAFINAAHAQGLAEGGFDPADLEAMTASVRQVELTEDNVTRLIASFPEIRKTGAKFSKTQLPEKPPLPGSGDSDLDALPADKHAALEAVAQKHGFKNLEEWSDTAGTVVRGYIFLAQGKKPGATDTALRLNVEHAERNPNLTAEQKADIIEMYRRIASSLKRLEPSDENYEMIVAMKDKLAPIMDPN